MLLHCLDYLLKLAMEVLDSTAKALILALSYRADLI